MDTGPHSCLLLEVSLKERVQAPAPNPAATQAAAQAVQAYLLYQHHWD